MAIMFNELVKTSVHIGMGNGSYIVVPMLTVADYDEYQKLQYELMQLNEKPDTTHIRLKRSDFASFRLPLLTKSERGVY